MLGKLIPIIIGLIGLGAGVGAGVALRPEPMDMSANPCGDMEHMATQSDEGEGEEDTNSDFVRLNNQFVVPVVKDGLVASLVVMSLTLEVSLGQQESVFEREPKLRDGLLQELFNHANAGGFDGAFTAAPQMNSLRKALLARARKEIGSVVKDVLIIDVVRQDAA